MEIIAIYGVDCQPSANNQPRGCATVSIPSHPLRSQMHRRAPPHEHTETMARTTHASHRPAQTTVRPVLILVALMSYTAVMVALTTLKAFYRIGYLWKPENQRRRGLSVEPFAELRNAQSWFGPAFEYWGNIAFFVPFGILIYVLLYSLGGRHPVRNTVLIGAFTSALMETAQYAFSLGYTDIDDLMMNTLGALLGGAGGKAIRSALPQGLGMARHPPRHRVCDTSGTG